MQLADDVLSFFPAWRDGPSCLEHSHIPFSLAVQGDFKTEGPGV